MSVSQPESVLVYVGLDRLGDGLLKLPFVRGLRKAFPNARITWLAGKDTSVYAGVLKSAVAGLIDEVIEKAGIGERPSDLLRRPLPGRSFDLLIDTQRVLFGTLCVWRIKHRTFVSPFGDFAISAKKPPKGYVRPETMQRQMMDLLEVASGQKFPTPKRLDLPIDPALRAEAERLLPVGRTYVGLAPGSGGLPKCWPLERYAALAQAQARAGRTPVFLLGPQETGWDVGLRDQMPDALFPLQQDDTGARHKFAPQLTIALAERLAVSVANDSGVGHLCAVSGQPIISLFGRTSPKKFPPMSDRLTIIQAQQWGDRELTAIPLAAVEQAVEAALKP